MTRSGWLAIVASAICALAPHGASAGVERTVLIFDGTGSDIHNCNGEPVALTGQIMILFHQVQDGAGGVHINETAVFQEMKGTGLVSGVTYELIQASPFTAETTIGATTRTVVGVRKTVGPGQVVDFTFRVLERATINADGELVVTLEKGTFECTQG
jgi:hypothetical protein